MNSTFCGNNNIGSLLVQTTSYVVDTKALFAYHNPAPWFLSSRSGALGASLGIFLNLCKSKLLISLTSAPPVFEHSPQDAVYLCSALWQCLAQTPIYCYMAYASSASPLEAVTLPCKLLTDKKACDYTNTTSTRLLDTQTQCSHLQELYSINNFPHLLASDVCHNLNTTLALALSEGISPSFISSVVNVNHHFLSHFSTPLIVCPPCSQFS